MQDPSFSRLATERLIVRRFAPDDAVALAAYRSDPEVARYQDWDCPYSIEEARAFVASLRGIAPGTPGTWFQLAVADPGGGALLGDCALRTSRADPRQGELGFTFARAHQGRGLAAEAVRAVLGYAFGRLGLHRVIARSDVRNLRAHRLLERTGFRREGELRESFWSKGQWTSERLYAQLASEWRPDR